MVKTENKNVMTNDVTMCSQHLMVTAQRFTVIIEEKLLLKLLSFFRCGQTEAGGSLVEYQY